MQFIDQQTERTQQLTAIVNEYAGSDNLRKALNRQKITYVKVVKGAKTRYILRGKGIDKIIITL